VAYHKLVSVFDTSAGAQEAVAALEKSGLPRGDIHPITADELKTFGATAHEIGTKPGFWSRILGEDVVEYEGKVFGNTIKAGGTVLTVRVPEADTQRAIDILQAHKAIDIDQRAHDVGAVAVAAVPEIKAVAQPTVARPVAPLPVDEHDQVIRLAEEQLKVGKEIVDAGTTKVHKFVIERPVEERVSLHEEHAEVLRRAVKDPSYVGDVDWGDQTVVVTETAERAVVAKVPLVAEEVIVRRAATDHMETIRDTIRKQGIEVQRYDAKGQLITR
jgi:uncharacterized protein (TIGR02271 family)